MRTRKLDVPEPIHAWLLRLQVELKVDRGRYVSLAETLEYVKAKCDAMDLLRETQAGQ